MTTQGSLATQYDDSPLPSTLALAPSSSAQRIALTDEDDEQQRKMWEGRSNFFVTVRLRPRLAHDRDSVDEIVRAVGHKEVIVRMNAASAPASSSSSTVVGRKMVKGALHHPLASPLPAKPAAEKRFAFDYVFSPRDGQAAVYDRTARFLVHGVLRGFPGTVFAYGCTGAGKTYTMLGTPDAPGIMARALEDLFARIQSSSGGNGGNVHSHRVSVSFLEVYNETIRDLLASGPSPNAAADALDLREDPVRGVVVAGLSEVEAASAREVMKLLRRGNKRRAMEATAANTVSSRSHAVLQVLVEPLSTSSGRSEEDGGPTTRQVDVGRLSLVDLAGSERAAVTQNRGQRLVEGANINRSLLALGNCINALADADGHPQFVPYRDSKLTRLLKDALGGGAGRTVMIATVGVAAASVEETLNTLKYANRAKNIKTTVVTAASSPVRHGGPSAVAADRVIAELRSEVDSLRRALSDSQRQLQTQQPKPFRLVELAVGSKASNNNKEGETEAEGDSEAVSQWQMDKVQAARQAVARAFEHQLRLQQALRAVDEQLQTLVGELRAAQPDDNNASSGQIHDTELLNWTVTVPDKVEAALAKRRERDELRAQLEASEARLRAFRGAVEQGAKQLAPTHALMRELLLMEFRVGDLERDNAALAQQSTAAAAVDDAWLAQLMGPSSVESPAPATAVTAPLTLPELKLPNAKALPMSTTPELDEEDTAAIAAAPAPTESSRRQWGIQMRNPALPYIRRKAQPPEPAVAASTSPLALPPAVSGQSGLKPVGTIAAFTAPYLQVLKQRQPPQRRVR